MKARRKDVILVVSIGIGLGLLLLAGIALLARPYYSAPTVQPSPSASAFTSSPAATSLPTITPVATLSAKFKASPTPTSVPETITYTVREGDNPTYIANRFSIPVERVLEANGLTYDDTVWPGDVLTIPLSAVTLSTPTPFGEEQAIIHTVVSGEVLSTIAEHYGVTVEAIMSANGLTSDAIQAGQELVIPLSEEGHEQPAPTYQSQDWQPSVLEGNLEASYPLTMERGRFTLHYQRDSLPAEEIDTIVGRVERALNHIESTLQVNLQGHFDAYVAGSLFASPNLALRGRSFSSQRRFFFLHDGTGTPADQQYILTHELTHLTTWNTMGRPISVMLHEGVAVYTGMELVKEADYIPTQTFCAAYQQIGQLPRVSGSPSFQGHIRDLDTYYAAGCFVKHLIEEYGPDKFAEVYHTGSYDSIYGKNLTDLEAEWLTVLESSNVSFSFEPEDLYSYVSEVAEGYDRLFANFSGTAKQMEAYRELDRARMAVLEGRFDDAEMHLMTFDQLLADAE